jgi:hypothetical protein
MAACLLDERLAATDERSDGGRQPLGETEGDRVGTAGELRRSHPQGHSSVEDACSVQVYGQPVAVGQCPDLGHVGWGQHGPATAVVRVLQADQARARMVDVLGISNGRFEIVEVERAVRLVGDGTRVDASYDG